MPKEPVTPPRPQPAEPEKPPVTDPQPYKDPVEPPPRDPQEDRPMRDPVEPDADRPRSWSGRRRQGCGIDQRRCGLHCIDLACNAPTLHPDLSRIGHLGSVASRYWIQRCRN